jgi:hypothetical protein
MAKYSDIKGFTVQTVTSDPAASVVATGSWASTPNINTGRMECFGTGPGTAGMICNGTPDGSDGNQVYDTEIYNGTSWTEVNNTDQRRQDGASAGVTTSALVTAGYTTSPQGASAFTESFDGTTWSEETNINNAAQGRRGMGASETAALIASAQPSNNCELWNGSTWTELNNQNTARSGQGTFGTSTAGIASGGASAPYVGNVESFDGTSWTEINDLNTARAYLSGSGTQPAGLVFGGNVPPVTGKTEGFDGTSWTEVGDLAVARMYGAGGGTQASAIFAGGNPAPTKSNAEEWTTTPSALFQKTIQGQLYFNSTTNTFKETLLDAAGGTWASGGALNSIRRIATACGTGETANMVTGGSSPPTTYATLNEQYNGSAWTEVGDLNVGKNNASSAGNSPIATTLNYAGDGPGTYSDTNESWNNTSWTEEADLNVSGNAASGFGVSSTSAGRAGGQSSATPPGGPHFTGTEIWNGTAWTEVNNLNASRRYAGGVGTVTAALYIGGDTDNPSFPGGRYTANTESWNGTSWTEVNNLNTARLGGKTGGTQTETIIAGGSPPGYLTNTELWNGSSWTEIADMTLGRSDHTGGGTAVSALASGGETAGGVAGTVEEWSGGLANKTITTS